MTAPAEALRRVLTGCLLGLGLGGWYEFLRPLRRRFPHLCDLLLLAAFGCCWIFFGFQICRGDLRLSHICHLRMCILCHDNDSILLYPIFLQMQIIFFDFCVFFSKFFRQKPQPQRPWRCARCGFP